MERGEKGMEGSSSGESRQRRKTGWVAVAPVGFLHLTLAGGKTEGRGFCFHAFLVVPWRHSASTVGYRTPAQMDLCLILQGNSCMIESVKVHFTV